jgi:hypothetical protein
MGWDKLASPTEDNNDLDDYDINSESEIIDIIYQKRIVTEREIKVMLEDKYFPWVVGRALARLVKEGKIKRGGYPGRKPIMGTPRKFYLKRDIDYWESRSEIGIKRNLSRDVNGILTRSVPAGMQAEEVFERAFISMGFDILRKDASEFNGKKVTGVPGKQPPNLDFIIKRGKKIYGVDIKNWIKFERDTVNEIKLKVRLALELDIIPTICARYVDKDTMFNEIILKGGLCYNYKHLILPTSFRSLSNDANRILGYPTIAVNELPHHKWIFLAKKVFKINI